MAAAKKSALLKTLRVAVKGLLYTSESDAPLKAIAWSGEETGNAPTALDAVAKVAGVEASAIQTVSLESFFEPVATPQDWWGEEEKSTGARFQELIKALSGLDGVAAYRVGDGPDIEVYIVGKDPGSAGSYAGVKTRVTET